MAKKSNKTAHVLNLISSPKHTSVESEIATTSNDSSTKTANDIEVDTATEINTNTEINPTIKKSLEKAAKNEALSNAIKDNLEKEFNDINNKNINQPNNIKNETFENTYQNNVDTILKNTIINENISESVQETYEKNKEYDNNIVENASENDDTDFLFINVCEKLVREKIDEYMDKFSTCKCKRCVTDTIALALSNLPPKYIVVNDKDDVPFISFYENKYKILLMTELTKACLKVMECPRHKI